jgi:5-dehydro-2-deoxygluconokinase
MNRTFDLVCLGRAAVDLYGEQIGCPLEEISTFAKYLGGSPANTAVGVSRLGLKSAMLSRVGDEQNGRFVRNQLAREGVDTSQVSTDPKRLTALVFLAIRDQDSFPHIFYRDHCADMGLEAAHVDTAFIASCGALLISGTHLSTDGTRGACMAAIAAARNAGTRIVFDIDYRPVLWGLTSHGAGASRYVASKDVTARLSPVLAVCDLIVGTEEEIQIAGGSDDTLTALKAIRKISKALIVLKRGPEGCIAYPGDIPASLEGGQVAHGFPVEVFNVLGAGDAFMAGFLRGWLRDEPIETCCRYANACGAIVVSRHGCSPAMATWPELQHFLAKGSKHKALRFDAELNHIHHATTRRTLAPRLNILAFDHRSQLEQIAAAHNADAARIPKFKGLVTDAFLAVSQAVEGTGVLLDERYGAASLARLTGGGFWIARPVEVPGSIPVAFETGANVAQALRTWPEEHVVKCLAYYHPDDPEPLRAQQLTRLLDLQEACRATGHELLLEVIPHANLPTRPALVAQALRQLYAAGLKPDWWKLPPSISESDWQAVGLVISESDPWCRGVLVLGMEADTERLRESFVAAALEPWCKGFAVGRSIFADAAHEWFAGRIDDQTVARRISERYRDIIALWDDAAADALSTSTLRQQKIG